MRVVLILALFWGISAGKSFPGDTYVKECLKKAIEDYDNAQIASKRDLASHSETSPKDLFNKERLPSEAAKRAARGAEIQQDTVRCVLDEVTEGGATFNTVTEIISPESLMKIAKEAGCAIVREKADCSDNCFHGKYRTIDGTCNSLKDPTRGASHTPFGRFHPAFYENGFNIPRGWTPDKEYNGFPLPSPRTVSLKVVSTKEPNFDNHFTHMLMQWGQFLDHDIDLTPVNPVQLTIKSQIPCSETCQNAMPCFPIPISKDDPRISRACMEFTRSSATCGSGGSVVREQINDITSYIDASNVYGSTKSLNNRLRDPKDKAFLRHGDKVQGHPGKYLLPYDKGDFAGCDKDPNTNTPCFLAGDKRANVQLGLTSMHMVFMREHNRLATELKAINGQWDSETIYQEARKILGGVAQVITYEHWLPYILGKDGMMKMGKYKGYNRDTDSSIVNEFATAAYRFGHGLINPIIERLDENFKPDNKSYPSLFLHQAFFAPHRIVKEGGIDPVIRGFIFDSSKLPEPKHMMNEEVTERLFELAKQVALDLAALNIQRGRDHGLPTYTDMREFCKLKKIKSFDDLREDIPSKKVRKALEENYGDPRNIDLFVGGLSEDVIKGAKVGPTFHCILTEQFRLLRDGDRFFYENPGVFTADQLTQIKKASLARILCDNGDNIDRVQPDVFIKVKNINKFKRCDKGDIPKMDLMAWKDEGNSRKHCD